MVSLSLIWLSSRHSINSYEMSGLNIPSVDPSGMRDWVSAVVRVREQQSVTQFTAVALHSPAAVPQGLCSELPMAK